MSRGRGKYCRILAFQYSNCSLLCRILTMESLLLSSCITCQIPLTSPRAIRVLARCSQSLTRVNGSGYFRSHFLSSAPKPPNLTSRHPRTATYRPSRIFAYLHTSDLQDAVPPGSYPPLPRTLQTALAQCPHFPGPLQLSYPEPRIYSAAVAGSLWPHMYTYVTLDAHADAAVRSAGTSWVCQPECGNL